MARMKDIADGCNVSVTTVSRVLNEDPTLMVSTEVRANIFKEAERIGYKTPRQRNKKDIFTVALVLDSIDKPGFERRLLNLLEPLALKYDIALKLFSYADDSFDALIVLGEFSDDDMAYFSSLTGNLLLLNNRANAYENDLIRMDYQFSSGFIFDFFMQKGVKSLGYFGGTCIRDNKTIGTTRLESFKRHLEANDMYDPSFFKTGKMKAESGYEVMMNQDPVPEGILFGDAEFMLGGMKALKERKLHPVCVCYDTFFDAVEGADAYIKVFTTEVWNMAFSMIREKITGARTQNLQVSCTPRLLIK